MNQSPVSILNSDTECEGVALTPGLGTEALPQPRPAVSITVVLYNSAECLRDCLMSVRQDVLHGFAELIVVDNASPDASAEIVQREFPEAILLRSTINRKFAGGCNFAWKHVNGKYWLLLNPDTVVPEGGLRKLVRWMDENPSLGVASPELIDAEGNSHSAGRRFRGIGLTLLELSRLHLLLPARVRENLLLGSYWRGGDHFDVDWVPGTGLLARREAVEDAGLLSETVAFYGEDSEWCWRIKKAGWRIGVCSGVQLKHQEGNSALVTWGEKGRAERMLRGTYDAFRKMHGPIYAKVLLLINLCSVAIEVVHPAREKQQRNASRKLLEAHLALLKARR